MEQRLFICHASPDSDLASRIVSGLEAAGLPCWISSRDVAPGDNFQDAIPRAIRAARGVVFLLTEASNVSTEVRKELALASRFAVQVFPLRLTQAEPSEALRNELATRQWIDATATSAVDVLCATLAPQAPAPPLPDIPSLVVLPFQNLSSDPDQAYFVAGMVDDITHALSRIGGLFVIARSSAYAYQGRAIDLRQIGRELGVRYVLEGSVRRASERVRIACQLVEAASATNVWTERFEAEIGDVFALQDRITAAVAGAMEPNLRRAEMARALAKPTPRLAAYDLALRGIHHQYKSTQASMALAVQALRGALAIEPDYALAKAYLAGCHGIRDTCGWAEPGDRAEAIRLAREALAEAGDDPLALRFGAWALGYFQATPGDMDLATAALRRALEIHPHSAQTLMTMGFMAIWRAQPTEAIAHLTEAKRLSPRDQEMGYLLHGLAMALLMLDRDAEALVAARRSLDEMPGHGSNARVTIIALVRLGRLEEARAVLADLLTAVPDTRLAKLQPPSAQPGFAQRFLADLRQAGYPP